jgi:hypothetical protein
MVRYFLPHCAEQSTLLDLRDMAGRSKRWREAHKLFSRIRGKTLRADAAQDSHLQRQYAFEEFCAKTLYNMADHSRGFSSEYLPPFDEDSPSWVVPCAVALALHLGLTDFEQLAPALSQATSQAAGEL